MTEQKHTRGPWKARRALPYETLENSKCYAIDGEGWGAFALIAVDMDFPSDTAEGQANARLIAAAPDMLDALKAILVEAQHHFSGCAPGPWKRMPPNLRAAIDRSRDAIGKAEGR